MKVFVIGGSGYVGARVAEDLVRNGADVRALCRTTASDAVVCAFGASPVRGNVSDIDLLIQSARSADCVIWASSFDPSELPVLDAVVSALARRSGSIIYTSGTAVVAKVTMGEADSNVFAEDTPFTPPRFMEIRVKAEQIVLSGVQMGVRAMVIRPPLVYGNGGSTQIPALFDSGLRSGSIRYIGRGLNRWSYLHIEDLGALYVAAAERGAAGAVYHGAAGEAEFRALAEAAAAAVGLEASSWSAAESEADSGYGKFMARIVLGSNSRTTSAVTERALGWRPQHRDLLEDIQNGSYKRRYSSAF